MTEVPCAQPIGSRPIERIAFLDVLRGVAILGILPVNAAYFAYAEAAAADPWYPTSDGVPGAGIVSALFEYKFITLFSLMFGIGIGLQRQRADARKSAFAPPMIRRLVALAVFGALHATLLWYGDIVFVYAWVGLALCWFAAARPGVLTWSAAALLVVPLLILAVLALGAAVSPGVFDEIGTAEWPDGDGAAAAMGSWREFFSALGAQNGLDPDFEMAVYSGPSFLRAVVLRTVTWAWSLVIQSVYFVPRIAGLVLLGTAAVRTGWALDPTSDGGRRLHRALAFVALPIGLLMESLATWLSFTADASVVSLLSEMLHYVGSLCLAGGYAAAIALAVCAHPTALWTRPLAAVGRMAFTCYITQTITMTTIFYGHGLALFGGVDRNTLMAVVVLIWIAQLTIASLWLRVFRIGPLEWIWRTITYMQPQPFLRGRGT